MDCPAVSSSPLLLRCFLLQFHPLIYNSESLRGKTGLWTGIVSQQVFVEAGWCIHSCSGWRWALTSRVNEIQSTQRVVPVREPDVGEITWLNGPTQEKRDENTLSELVTLMKHGTAGHEPFRWEPPPLTFDFRRSSLTLLWPFKHIYVW